MTCRSVRIGSYKVAPTDRVLFSSEGVMIEVPVINEEGKLFSKKTTKLALSQTQILKLDVQYGKCYPIMFIYLTQMASRGVRENFKMTRDDSEILFDPLSDDETNTTLTLLPDHLTNENKMGAYKQVTGTETIDMLIRSCYSVKLVRVASIKFQYFSSLYFLYNPQFRPIFVYCRFS